MWKESTFSKLKKSGRAKRLSAIILTSLLFSGCVGPDDEETKLPPDPVAAVVQKVGASMVNIETEAGKGSGVILNEKGYIVTNDHVIRGGGSSLEVHLLDKRSLKATLIGTDPRIDIAVIKVEEADNLQPAEFGDSKTVNVGDDVIAIGNARGIENSVTKGIISNLNVSVDTGTNIRHFLQTDAPINPGNSGGALVNMTGKVIGINDMKRTDSESINYAIPINDVKGIVDQIIDNGYVSLAYIGINGANEQTSDGEGYVKVVDLMPDSPAIKAGLQKGDMITYVNDARVETVSKLREQIKNSGIDTMVSLRIARPTNQGLQTGIIQVKLEELPKALYYPIDWS